MTVTATGVRYRCKHCPAVTCSTFDAARMLGWRFFTGKSVTGKEINDVVCPACAGNAEPPEKKPTWRVGCRTCDWEWEDEYDEGALTAKDAKHMANDHECEPDVWIAPPSGDAKYDPYKVNDDGSLR